MSDSEVAIAVAQLQKLRNFFFVMKAKSFNKTQSHPTKLLHHLLQTGGRDWNCFSFEFLL